MTQVNSIVVHVFPPGLAVTVYEVMGKYSVISKLPSGSGMSHEIVTSVSPASTPIFLGGSGGLGYVGSPSHPIPFSGWYFAEKVSNSSDPSGRSLSLVVWMISHWSDIEERWPDTSVSAYFVE